MRSAVTGERAVCESGASTTVRWDYRLPLFLTREGARRNRPPLISLVTVE